MIFTKFLVSKIFSIDSSVVNLVLHPDLCKYIVTEMSFGRFTVVSINFYFIKVTSLPFVSKILVRSLKLVGGFLST